MRYYQIKDEKELLALVATSDEKAFVELYNRFWERLLSFAHAKTGDMIEAENLVQDVFISLWKRRATLHITSEVSSYLMVSVKYRVIRLLEQQRTRRLHEQRSLEAFVLLDDSTQQYLDLEELRSQLEASMCKLPETSALVFRLSREEGMSYREISAELGISEQAVNAHIVRAKKSLTLSLRTFLTTFLL